jgi:hypothetical protein
MAPEAPPVHLEKEVPTILTTFDPALCRESRTRIAAPRSDVHCVNDPLLISMRERVALMPPPSEVAEHLSTMVSVIVIFAAVIVNAPPCTRAELSRRTLPVMVICPRVRKTPAPERAWHPLTVALVMTTPTASPAVVNPKLRRSFSAT